MTERIVLNPPELELVLQHNESTAWFLGLLCTRGSIKKTGEICFQTQNQEFAQKFLSVGTEVLGINGTVNILQAKVNRRQALCVSFYSKTHAQALGNLNNDNWFDTLEQKHNWIFYDTHTTWAFLAGYFEAGGSVSNPEEKRHEISLNVSTEKGLQFLVKALNFVGVTNIGRHVMNEKLRNIRIGGIKHVHAFAVGIGQSFIAEKEERLRLYRRVPETLAEVNRERFEAYDLVMKLRSQGLSRKELHNHPSLKKYCLTRDEIENWIYKGHNPRKIEGRYVNPLKIFVGVLDIIHGLNPNIVDKATEIFQNIDRRISYISQVPLPNNDEELSELYRLQTMLLISQTEEAFQHAFTEIEAFLKP